MRAATVSACLRRGGLNPLGSGTPADREGVRVKQSREQVRVVIDVDDPSRRAAIADDAASILSSAGYEFERRPVTFDVGDIDVFVVTRREARS